MSTNIAALRSEVQGLIGDLQQAQFQIGRINRLLTTYLSLARRFGLPDNIMEGLVVIQQARVAVMGLYRSIQLFYAASGPIGWAIALGSLGVSAIMTMDVAMSVAEIDRRSEEW